MSDDSIQIRRGLEIQSLELQVQSWKDKADTLKHEVERLRQLQEALSTNAAMAKVMTAEEQRRAIAEWHKSVGGKMPQIADEDGSTFEGMWDYCGDLNAIHEVEEMLTEKQRGDYMNELDTFDENHEWKFIHATAAQRAEALLKTIGLWQP